MVRPSEPIWPRLGSERAVGMWRDLPQPSASRDCVPQRPRAVDSQDAQMWDCYADKFQLHEYAYLREARVKTNQLNGTYLFTAAFIDDGFTRTPEQGKEFSFIELENGRLTIQPTNRTLFEDKSFTVNTGVPKDLLTQTQVWSCE
jgi:hypothetical protein